MDLMKKCAKCFKTQDSACFYKIKKGADGLHSYCKQCCRENSKNYRVNNKEKVKSSQRAWYEKNKISVIETSNNWKADNPERAREIWKKSMKKRRASGKVNKYKISVSSLLERWGNCCYICNKPIDLGAPRSCSTAGWEQGLHIDHVLPRALGGNNSIENLRPTHGLCNIKKKDRMIEDARI